MSAMRGIVSVKIFTFPKLRTNKITKMISTGNIPWLPTLEILYAGEADFVRVSIIDRVQQKIISPSLTRKDKGATLCQGWNMEVVK